MNPANPTPPNDKPDERLVALLRSAAADAPLPDRAFLARLRDQSAAAFAAPTPTTTPADRSKGRAMYLRILGALTATAAALAILVFTLVNKPGDGPVKPGEPRNEGKSGLARALDDTVNANTLRYKVTAGGQTRDVMAEKAGRWREDRPDGAALVSDGDMTWRLDKDGKASRATATRQTRDLVAAVLAGARHGAIDLNRPQPAGTEKHGDEEFIVYRLDVEAEGGPIRIDALVSDRTKTLRSMTARSGGKVIGELEVTAVNGELPEDKFLVLNSLSEDGRVGKITDTQGTVAVKPLAQSRWTPVSGDFVIMPGDWLRTDIRGANAAAVKLLSRVGLILGPGTVVEIARSTQIKLLEGELEIAAPKNASIELIGPEDQRVVVKGTQHYYLDRSQRLRLAGKEPLWLKGFKGATANESIGSLVAKVDGRAEPLSVGYHKVTVDIRDQIARTTIEESFVNHTNSTLEGVFTFPLPQDASIAEFGMWIGNELVMADVVEKQRAREIYEQIKREKRDPGLLEWSGGNNFTARVWPIFGGSEKRIKITYTQVLPLKGNKYVYSYALQSEMLLLHPLRELSLSVNVASAVPLKKVWSPTHSTRDQATPNAARVEFSAQEYTPRKDFEVVIEQDRRPSDVVLVPHRRGGDGYFLLQVMPPAVSLERAVLPDSGPVRLLIVADTSASMDRRQRQQQEAFVAALVAALTPRDTFNLACCDVTCDWTFEKPVAADARNLMAARDMLQKRVSLGWSDLDKSFASAMEAADARTHVVYVGDGIPVTANVDPVAFARRLRSMYAGRGTFHAVTTGSTFEPGVAKAIASLGGGSWRRIGAEQGPTGVALELLREMTQPTLRDVKVAFAGLRTARVYPAELPNVPAGTQQILLGRYLPDGGDQQGEVTVSGTLEGKPMKMTTKVSLKDAESGNSFIPRLWARMHLDALLEMGSSEAIKDEVIALSEEYNIITPYTSFLVLETDADRERFGVKKRFRMRDGEKFFAEGRDKVDFALVQQQMKRAGTWRVNLRREALRSFATLGRNPLAIRREYERREETKRLRELDELTDGASFTIMDSQKQLAGNMAFGGGFLNDPNSMMTPASGGGAYEQAPFGSVSGAVPTAPPAEAEPGQLAKNKKELYELSPLEADDQAADKDAAPGREIGDKKKSTEALGEPDAEGTDLVMPGPPPGPGGQRGSGLTPAFADSAGGFSYAVGDSLRTDAGRFDGYLRVQARLEAQSSQDSRYWQQQWWTTLFPPLPPAARVTPPKPSKWPEPARQLAQSLLRRDKLQQLKGGLDIRVTGQSFDPRYSELTGQVQGIELYSPRHWLASSSGDGQQTVINWCDGKERGLIHRAFQVGRLRPAKPEDVRHELGLSDYSLSALDENFRDYTATVEEAGRDRARLLLKRPRTEVVVLIDTARHVLLEIEYRNDGKRQSRVTFDDFVEAAGGWWARKVETTNDKGQRIALSTYTVKELTDEQLTARMAEELAGRDQVLFTRVLPKLADARTALAAGKAGLEDHITLLHHFAAIQQWTRVREHLQAIEKLTDKPARRWLRDAVAHLSRRFDELRQRQVDEAGALAEARMAANDALVLARHVYTISGNFMQAAELQPLLEKLAPVYQRQPAHLHAARELSHNRMNLLQNLGRMAEARAILKQLAADYPRDEGVQRQYAQWWFNEGDFPAGYAWIEKALAANPKWTDYEEETLRGVTTQYLMQQGRVDDLLRYAEAWMARKPSTSTPYAIYLSMLIRSDREEQARTTLAQWLKDGRVHGEMKPDVAGRLGAAIALALGQGWNMYTYRLEERWVPALVETVRFFAHDERNGHFADQIMPQLQNHGSDEVVKLRKDIAGDLFAAANTLTPARINRLLGWLSSYNEPEYWARLTAVLRQRWSAEKDWSLRAELGGSILTILRQRATPDELLAFLRLQWESSDENKAGYARQLFDTLIAQPWKQEYEDEALALLGKLGEHDTVVEAPRTPIEALHQFTDRMVAGRTAVLNQKIERPDQLTRTELRDKQSANLKQARTEVADRLAKETPRATKDLAPWIRIERMYLDTILERNLAQVEADCWEIIGSEPPRPVDPEAEAKPGAVLEGLLKERAFTMLNYLATRRKADAASFDRLLKFLDKAIAQEGTRGTWKAAKHRLLIAADRPRELEKDLQQWVQKGPQPNYWRLHLGFLLAELGRLNEAVALFEKIRDDHELGPQAYRSLADWYMVLNEKEKHEQAVLDRYRFTEEYQLSRMINVKLYPWNRGGGHVPSELDRDVLRMFAVLFEKSAQPANYVYQLGAFYNACRDFRLLAVLADAVVGQTPVKVYPFLQSMGQVLGTIQDEAVVDELMEQLNKTRQKAQSAVDQRALDLMEVLVRRRAAELQNQPAPHGDSALAAMKRAFQRQWVSGEQPLMAYMLLTMSRIAYKPLADEQLSELKWLYEQQKKAAYDRLRVGHFYAQLLGSYERFPEAIEVLNAELADYLAAAVTGILPPEANEVVGTLVSYCRQTMRHAQGESYLLERLKKPGNDEQRIFYIEQLDNLYVDALARDGNVSLGKGVDIYPALERKLRKDSAEPNPYHQYRMVQIACALYTTAKQKVIGAYVDDLRSYGNKLLPEILKHYHNYYDSTVNQVAGTIHQLLGPVDAIEFVLNRVEKEPEWFRLNGQDGWSRHGHSLAYWRNEVKNIGELEPRLLRLVLKELRRDLDTRQGRNRSMYHRPSGYYWVEKDSDFLKVAEEVYEKRQTSAAHVLYLADYFYNGLGRPARAIEILYAAHEKKMLDENGISVLVRYLREQNRHGEAIVLLEPLVGKNPGNLTYRVWLMNSYFNVRQLDKLHAALKDAHDYFHKENRWGEGVCATLAQSTLGNELWAESAEYYKECIPLRQRSAPNRGIGDGALAEYYSNLARAYSRLGKTEEAVDAASGAVVAWPANHNARQLYLDRLREVLAEARDLDGFVAGLDRREKESGQGSPVVRKSIAKAYQSRGQFAKAVPQYKAALELQPEDFESHDQLIACYDQLNDKEGAIAATLEAVGLARQNLALYRKLGERMQAQERFHDAERAFTSIVEMQPSETESHALLAQVRQAQSRLDEAAAHWEQAARLRALEPTALVELARVQLALKQWGKADVTLQKLEKTTWPARFDAERQTIRALREEWKRRK